MDAQHEPQVWSLDSPRVLDVGAEGEQVTALRVAIVGGRVDVVTHDDSPTARVEVTAVAGLPVRVRWDGTTLSVTHGKDSDPNVLEMIRRTVESFGRNSVTVSISVPVATDTSVSTVSAAALVSGLRQRVRVNTVSGRLTLTDLHGDLDLNTVTGEVECATVSGSLTVNTVSGGVTVQRGDLDVVEVNTVSADVALDLTTGRSRVTSNGVTGDVTVRAPFRGYDVEGSTATGQVVVDGVRLTTGGYLGRGHSGRLRDGDGGLHVKASAVSGNLVVLRSEPLDLPATTPQDAPLDPGHPEDHAPHDWRAEA